MARRRNSQAEHVALARRLHAPLARAGAEDGHCTLLIVRPFATSLPAKRTPSKAWNLGLLARRIRPLLRETDEIHLDDERSIAIVLRGTGYRGGRIVLRRLADALEGLAFADLGAPAPGPDRRHEASWRLVLGCGEVTRLDLATAERLALIVAQAWQAQETVAPSLTPRYTTTFPPMLSRETLAQITNPPRRRITSVPLIALPARPSENVRTTPLIQGQTQQSRRTPRLRVIRGGRPRYSEEIMRQHAQALGVPFLRLPRRLPGGAWHGISAELAHELRAVPVGFSQHVLTVAMDNPRNVAAVLRLRAITGLAIFPVLALPEELDRALDEIAE